MDGLQLHPQAEQHSLTISDACKQESSTVNTVEYGLNLISGPGALPPAVTRHSLGEQQSLA